jgi:hypothetical protein
MNRSCRNNGAPSGASVIFFINRYSLKFFIINLLFFLFLSIHSSLFSQTEKTKSEEKLTGNPSSAATGTNFDGRMLAGLNGDSMFSLSLTQGLKNFAYQLNSNFSNFNDSDGYDNTGFLTNETGFTGELSATDYWKIMPEFEIGNSSYGMYDNPNYNRENKDKIRLRLKNEYKPVPARWDFDLNYARYDHILKNVNNSDDEEEDTFHTLKGIIGMEYIWSASNKVGLRSVNGLNKYSGNYEDDFYSSNEFYVSFKVTEYTMLTLTPMVCWNKDWNKDWTDYFYFKGNISTINLKYISMEILHEYKLSPYRPEDVLYSQKFTWDRFDLPPAVINHSELKAEVETETLSDTDILIGIKKAGLRLKGIFEDNNNFYNYYLLPQNILDVQVIPANYLNGRAEFVTSLIFLRQVINIDFVYDYYRYFPQKTFEKSNVTYRPDNTYSCNLSFEGPWLEINWKNTYRGSVYVDPTDDRKLGSSLLGTLDIDIKLYDTFHLNSRIINLYNEEYFLREGYPEPGIQFFTGLRIII